MIISNRRCPSITFLVCSLIWFFVNLTVTVAEEERSSHNATQEDDGHSDEGEHNMNVDEIAYEGSSHEEHESEPGHAVLFPSFSLTLGLVVFYVLTR